MSVHSWFANAPVAVDPVVVFPIEVQPTELTPFPIFAQRCGHRFSLGLVAAKAAGFLDQAVVQARLYMAVTREDRLSQGSYLQAFKTVELRSIAKKESTPCS
jgi:hypothetical protein